MSPQVLSTPRGDGRLWGIALILSVMVNAAFIIGVAFVSLRNQQLQRDSSTTKAAQLVPQETTVMIFPEMVSANAGTAQAQAAPALPPVAKPRFSRTSEDQAAETPEAAAFIGERDTRATSDRRPASDAPPLPSQAGIPPRDSDHLETTQSDYRDGDLKESPSADPPPQAPADPPAPAVPEPMPDPSVATSAESGSKTNNQGPDNSKPSPASKTELLQGPNPVDVPVARDPSEQSDVKPTPPGLPKAGDETRKDADAPKPTPPKAVNDPAFSGYQRKTAIVGSISRTGRSAMDVVDSPLGRYQAIISRLIEQEWQRNCVRHRDFITPGFLTVRFFVEPSGRIKTVQFVGKMETGEVQKGFTLNSIRDAKIPAMPPAVKKEFEKEPLELIFNFYF